MRVIILSFILLCSFKVYSQIYTDFIYDAKVRTVQFYPKGAKTINTPLIPLGSSRPLVMHFDLFGNDAPYFNFRLVHCNYDWTKSQLTDLEVLGDYNTFQINDIDYSAATLINYTHYSFEIPRVKLSGNYVVEVFYEDNPDVILLQRRFSVFEQRIKIASQIGFTKVVSDIRRNQQLDMRLVYGDLNITNPTQSIHVVLRQNYRWDHAITKLRPSIVREDLSALEFNFFQGENDFPGLNEYRQFDVSNVRNPRFWVDSVVHQGKYREVFLRKDISRKYLGYVSDPDENGQFIIDNALYGAPETDADYMWVNFSLASPEEAMGDVYVFGQMSDWQCQERFKMKYNIKKGVYKARILLKQGYYDYAYAVKSKNGIDETYYEGSHNLTENDYDILVYYRPFGKYGDKLAGYKVLGGIQ